MNRMTERQVADSRTHYPVTLGGKPDTRYTVRIEFCGAAPNGLAYVVRYCGEWVGQSAFLSSAKVRAIGLSAEHRGAAIVTEVRA